MTTLADKLRDCRNFDEWTGALMALALNDADRGLQERAAMALIKKAIEVGGKIDDDLSLVDQAKAAAKILQARH